MPFFFMAGLTGLEPATSSVTGWHSNQLSYNPNYNNDKLFLNEWWAKQGSNL